jgi:hypothetical protein
MKFSSPTDEPIYLALTTGHTCVIGAEPVEVAPRFHREAVAAGAIPAGTEKSVAVLPKPEANNTALITDALRAMAGEGKPDDFTGAGLPKVEAVSKRVGFTVTREQVATVWSTLTA